MSDTMLYIVDENTGNITEKLVEIKCVAYDGTHYTLNKRDDVTLNKEDAIYKSVKIKADNIKKEKIRWLVRILQTLLLDVNSYALNEAVDKFKEFYGEHYKLEINKIEYRFITWKNHNTIIASAIYQNPLDKISEIKWDNDIALKYDKETIAEILKLRPPKQDNINK